jgi:16S rRNA processing protein RimM
MTVQGGVKAGKISKPYGLQGDVHIILIPAVAQKLKVGNPLFIDIDGQRIPFFMETLDLVSDDQAIMKVEFINSVEEARKVCGFDVYIEAFDSGDEALPADTNSPLIGYRVFDEKLGEIGVLTDHIPQKMSPVWVVENVGREILIPAAEDFIQKIDHKNNLLHLNLPEGLTEL